MPAREFGVLTAEATYGAYNSGGTKTVLEMRTENPFTPRQTPIFTDERSAGASNRAVMRISEQAGFNGKMSTRFFPSQGKVLWPYILGITGSPFNLPSFSFDHAIVLDDGSATIKQRYLGGMVRGCSLKCTNTGTAATVPMDLDLVFQSQTTTTFTEPTWATTPGYPLDIPFVFQGLKGNVTIATVSRANFMDFSLDINNILRTPYDENEFISVSMWSGRDVTFGFNFRYLSATDRTAYQNVAAQGVTLAFFDGVNTGTFTLNGQNFSSTVVDSLPWGDPGFYQNISYKNFLDTSVPNDITYAQTP